MFIKLLIALAISSVCTIAIATIDRTVAAWFEGNLGILTTLGADRREHLPSWSIASVAVAFGSPYLPAGRATLRLVGVALGGEELLFARGEAKAGSAVGTLECLVLVLHKMTSSLEIWLVRAKVIQYSSNQRVP